MATILRSHLRARTAALLLGFTLLGATPALAASGFYIRGAGDGHGIGMSQYGALGFAQHGFTDTQILSHYYANTSLGTTNPNRIVTVLLETGSAAFSGDSGTLAGRRLNARATYTVVPAADGDLSVMAHGKAIVSGTAPLTVTGSGPLTVAGLGQYRGSLVFRPDGSGGVETINAVGLEDYVRGVVAAEMPASWPMAALEAQAIAARTYAITDGVAGPGFDVYSDTRSQMYRGVSAETPSTDAAIVATRGEVVTYAGSPAVTYFFASSGGYTESIQNVWEGVTPEAWLIGKPDPYDNSGGNPFYRWHVKMSVDAAAGHLRGLLRGALRGIEITEHGVSPRIVEAEVIGTKGRTTVTGAQLQQAFGLMSTYESFTTITTKSVNSGSGDAVTTTEPPVAGSGASASSGSGSGSGSGGAALGADFRRTTTGPIRARRLPLLAGSVFPAARGERIAIERLGRHGYTTVARVRTGADGSYAATVPAAGRYRVVVAGNAGPGVTLA